MNLGGVGIVRAKGLRDDGERPLGVHLDVVVAALGLVQRREIIEQGRDLGVIWAEHHLADAEGALVERLRLIEPFLACVHGCRG